MLQKIKKIILKKNKKKIICLTAYSKNFATEIDKHADITLVGDSLLIQASSLKDPFTFFELLCTEILWSVMETCGISIEEDFGIWHEIQSVFFGVSSQFE